MDSASAFGREARAVNPNDWKRAKELFSTAVTLDEAERDAYIDSQPDSNEILDEARSLLAAYLESPDFLEGAVPELPPVERRLRLPSTEPTLLLPQQQTGAPRLWPLPTSAPRR